MGWGGKFCTCTQKEVTKNRVVYSEELEGVKGRFRETKKEQSGIKCNYVSTGTCKQTAVLPALVLKQEAFLKVAQIFGYFRVNFKSISHVSKNFIYHS